VWLCTDNRREYYCFEGGSMTVMRYPAWLRLLALPRRIALVRLLLRGYPWSNAFLYFPLFDASYIARALYLGTRNPVGASIAEFPAYVRPCRFVRKLLGGKMLLVEHNVEYERLREQIKTLSERGYQQLKRTELVMCEAADAIVTVSDNDRAILMRDGIAPHKIHTIPHGVDVNAFRNAVVDDVRSLYGIAADALLLVYHGPYSYAPNLQAMQVMATEILPRLLAQNLKVEVLAIGSKPPAEALHGAIHFTGAVPDLTRILPAADIAVVPLLEGGGTRMKILDYFAAGVPVISTSKGVEGIPVTTGHHLVVVDDVEGICAAIRGFAADPAHARLLARNATAFVQESSWDNIAAQYMPLLQPQKPAQQ
jgi:glycosyltransferase involved in cell wall biosynthesis